MLNYVLLIALVAWVLFTLLTFIHCWRNPGLTLKQKTAWTAGFVMTLTAGIVPYTLLNFQPRFKFVPLATMVLCIALFIYSMILVSGDQAVTVQ